MNVKTIVRTYSHIPCSKMCVLNHQLLPKIFWPRNENFHRYRKFCFDPISNVVNFTTFPTSLKRQKFSRLKLIVRLYYKY